MATEYTKTDWIATAATYLIENLPLSSYDDATDLVDAYLDEVGWTEDADDDTIGYADNEYTPAEAGAAIVTEQSADIREVTLTMNVNVTFTYVTSSGETDADLILESAEDDLLEYVQNRMDASGFTVNSISDYSGDVTEGGTISSTVRSTIQTNIEADSYGDNPIAVAVANIRAGYSLDETWNASSIFVSSDTPLVVTVKQYTDTDYDEEDSSATSSYMVAVDTSTGKVITGTRTALNT